jgi:hypothetical protein
MIYGPGWGSDAVVVGGSVADNFTPERISGDVSANEFGMHMKLAPLYVKVIKCPLAGAESVSDINAYRFPDPDALGGIVDTTARNLLDFGSGPLCSSLVIVREKISSGTPSTPYGRTIPKP